MTLTFTDELENNNTLPFLDILLINNNNKLEFKVHHKSTDENDHIHFYIIISKQRGISLYFRALKICTLKFLNDEFDYTENSFMQLQYPKSFI